MLYEAIHPELHRKVFDEHHEAMRRSARDSRLARQVRRDRRARRRADPSR
jgi:hypothetical protein